MSKLLVDIFHELEYLYDTLQPSMAEGDGRFYDEYDKEWWIRVTVRESDIEDLRKLVNKLRLELLSE